LKYTHLAFELKLLSQICSRNRAQTLFMNNDLARKCSPVFDDGRGLKPHHDALRSTAWAVRPSSMTGVGLK
jgi:hypothetical protein